MKWPLSITLVRHGESRYNELRRLKDRSERYELFKKAFNKNPLSAECRELAEEIYATFALHVSDYDTPLTALGSDQGRLTGMNAKSVLPQPDVVIVSPYQRTRDTFHAMAGAWTALYEAQLSYDDRIREQEHGLYLLYNDWRVFQTFHPEQRRLRNLLGPYWYQYPQGESVVQTRERVRSITNTIVREWAGKHVMLITHHLTILSIRANFERLSPEEFMRLDEEEKPRNCGVTLYRGNPNLGKDGKLELEYYNRSFWDKA